MKCKYCNDEMREYYGTYSCIKSIDFSIKDKHTYQVNTVNNKIMYESVSLNMKRENISIIIYPNHNITDIYFNGKHVAIKKSLKLDTVTIEDLISKFKFYSLFQ